MAHSVNEFEENDVTVSLREDGSSLGVGGIGAHHGRVVGIAFQDPARLKELAEWVLSQVQAKIGHEQTALLALAKEYGAERIKAFGNPHAGKLISGPAAKRGRTKP